MNNFHLSANDNSKKVEARVLKKEQPKSKRIRRKPREQKQEQEPWGAAVAANREKKVTGVNRPST